MQRQQKKYRISQERISEVRYLNVISTTTSSGSIYLNGSSTNTEYTNVTKMLGSPVILKRDSSGIHNMSILNANEPYWNRYTNGSRLLEHYTDWLTFEELMEELEITGMSSSFKSALIRTEV